MTLLKRWILCTLQGSIAPEHLQDHLNELTFRYYRLGLLYLNSRKGIACNIISSGAAIEQIVISKKYTDGR